MQIVMKKEEGLELSPLEEARLNEFATKLSSKHHEDSVLVMSVSEDRTGDNLVIDWELHEPKFDRIRRITGYLVGTIDRWNDAKRAEEHDRVKHMVGIR